MCGRDDDNGGGGGGNVDQNKELETKYDILFGEAKIYDVYAANIDCYGIWIDCTVDCYYFDFVRARRFYLLSAKFYVFFSDFYYDFH